MCKSCLKVAISQNVTLLLVFEVGVLLVSSLCACPWRPNSCSQSLFASLPLPLLFDILEVSDICVRVNSTITDTWLRVIILPTQLARWSYLTLLYTLVCLYIARFAITIVNKEQRQICKEIEAISGKLISSSANCISSSYDKIRTYQCRSVVFTCSTIYSSLLVPS